MYRLSAFRLRSRLAFLRAELRFENFARVAHLAVLCAVAVDSIGCEFSVLPRQIKYETSPRAQSFDRAVRPRFRKRGQQVNEVMPVRVPDVTLQKHFRDAGRRAEIAVNLKWRVRVEQIRIQPAPAGRRGI